MRHFIYILMRILLPRFRPLPPLLAHYAGITIYY